jgi:dTDP-L-rhamnose 4-epimerase
VRVLVTGGAGFIGSWVVASLLESGRAVTVIDNLSPQVHGALPHPDVEWLRNGEAEFIRADIRDLSVMDEVLGRVDAVVHLAAETGTGQSMYQIAHYYDVNLQATAALLEAVGTRHRHVGKIVLASSRSIYGEGAYELDGRILTARPREVERMRHGEFEPLGPNGEPMRLVPTPEDITPMPASVYAATKLANESLARIFSGAYGVSVLALRFQNVYGERQSLRNPYTGILSIFSNRMRRGLPVNIFEDGMESRDFVHVSDAARAISLALDRTVQGFHALNIGSGVPTSVLQIAETLRALLGSQSELTVTGDFRAGDIRHCYADLARAREVLGYAPLLTVDQGLALFCRWVMAQQVMEDRSEEAMNELVRLGLSGRPGSGEGV